MILRQAGSRDNPLLDSISILFQIDPVFMVLAFSGLIFAALRKDLFILLWIIPSLLFLYFTGYYPYRVFISSLPVFSIGAAVLIVNLAQKIKFKYIQRVLPWCTILVIGVFGLISSTILITTNITSSQFQTAAFVTTYLNNDNNKNKNITVASSPIYSWIFNYVYKNDNVLSDYRDILYQPIKTDNILLVADDPLKSSSISDERLGILLNNTVMIATVNESKNKLDSENYPYTSLLENDQWWSEIEVGVTNKSRAFATLP